MEGRSENSTSASFFPLLGVVRIPLLGLMLNGKMLKQDARRFAFLVPCPSPMCGIA